MFGACLHRRKHFLQNSDRRTEETKSAWCALMVRNRHYTNVSKATTIEKKNILSIAVQIITALPATTQRVTRTRFKSYHVLNF